MAIGYRDMTFCPFSIDCVKAPTCHRALTPEVHASAVRWWGGPDYPICLYSNQPECHELAKETGDG